jgi:large subunit ribosomal protein L3
MNGLIGKKIGMTSAFTSDGRLVPVTVVQVGPCVITQVKTQEKDGYTALQLGFDETPVEKLNKPVTGHLKKVTDKGYRVLKEFRIPSVEGIDPGAVVGLDIFAVGEKVTVTGTTKGRGFQGTIKRHGFKVIKGKRMPGHMGVEKETVKNLTIVDIKPNDNLILLKGAVPGPKTGIIKIFKTSK